MIFDSKVATVYLSLMASLGVEINLSKSVVANREVVEFAKRTSMGGTDVSALPWKSFIVNNTLLGRANIMYGFYRRYMLRHPLKYLTSWTSLEGKKESVNLTLLTLLGMLANDTPDLIIHVFRKCFFNLKKLSKFDILRMDTLVLWDLVVRAMRMDHIETKAVPNEER